MKKTLLVLALAAVLVFSLTTVASAKYASKNIAKPYLPWSEAQVLAATITSGSATQTTPHGGYTATSVKCVVCHSTHRAYTASTAIGVGIDNSLLNGAAGSCTSCHAAWGANPSAALIEVGQGATGPHMGTGGSTCGNRGCHGSVHGAGAPSKYATAVRYNLTNGTGGLLDTQMDAAIAAGNTNAEIGLTDLGATNQAMKAYTTGYVCYPCHAASAFSIAARGYAQVLDFKVYPATTPVPGMGTGHPSTGMSTAKWVPTCEGCHDMLGVATGTTAFPHATRGIDVYKGRFDNYTQTPVYGTTIATDNGPATQYGLWMTSAAYHDNVNAQPIVDVQNGYSLQDGSCIKCHQPEGLK